MEAEQEINGSDCINTASQSAVGIAYRDDRMTVMSRQR